MVPTLDYSMPRTIRDKARYFWGADLASRPWSLGCLTTGASAAGRLAPLRPVACMRGLGAKLGIHGCNLRAVATYE
jgi:hypothetical protein